MNYHRNDEEMMRQAKGDEPITIDKLNDELESLLEEQAEMRKRNGYEGLSDDEAKKLKGRPDSYGYSELVYSSLDFAIISDKITNLRVHIKHLKWTQ